MPVPEPGPGELLLRIGAATTCGTDLKVFQRGGHPRMLKAPTPFGHEMAGTITAVGTDVERWRPGDRVVVANSAPCGVCEWCSRGRENLCSDLQYLNGAFSEYLLVPRRFAEVSTYPLPAEPAVRDRRPRRAARLRAARPRDLGRWSGPRRS